MESIGKYADVDPYSLDDAKDALSKRRTQGREKKLFDVRVEADMTFKEISDWYIGLDTVKVLDSYYQVTNSLRKFNLVFGNRIVDEIKRSELMAYRVKREKEKAAYSTIDQEVGPAKATVAQTFMDDKVYGSVLKRFKSIPKYLSGDNKNSNQRTRLFSPVEFTRLERVAPTYRKNFYRTLYDTGMRDGKVFDLKWGMVSLKEHCFHLPKEIRKDDEDRDVPISDKAYKILESLPRGIHDDYHVFTHGGKPIQKYSGWNKRRL